MEVTLGFSRSSLLNSILGGIFLLTWRSVIIVAQAPVLSANPSTGTEGSPFKLVCTLSATAASVKWWRKEKTDTTQTEVNVVTVGILSGICTPSPDPPPDNLVTTCSSLVYGCTIPSLNTTSDGDVWRCSIAIGMVTTHSNTLQISVTASPTTEVTTTTTTTTPSPECPDCCCCKEKKRKDIACGVVLSVCIFQTALLGFFCYKGFKLQAVILVICTSILCISALCGFVLSTICLSKECCSGNEECCQDNEECCQDNEGCCQVEDCLKAEDFTGFVLAGISLLGSIPVGVLIFKNAGKSGNEGDHERQSSIVNTSNHPPENKDKEAQYKHSAGSVASKTGIIPSFESNAAYEVTLRAQPLPPVGQQGRGLSANYRDGMDDMPMIGQKKSLPPLEGTGGEDPERRKRKKKKKKTNNDND